MVKVGFSQKPKISALPLEFSNSNFCIIYAHPIGLAWASLRSSGLGRKQRECIQRSSNRKFVSSFDMWQNHRDKDITHFRDEGKSKMSLLFFCSVLWTNERHLLFRLQATWESKITRHMILCFKHLLKIVTFSFQESVNLDTHRMQVLISTWSHKHYFSDGVINVTADSEWWHAVKVLMANAYLQLHASSVPYASVGIQLLMQMTREL